MQTTTDKVSKGSLTGVALACALGNILSLSCLIFYTFSIFLVPVTASLGWERADFSFCLTVISIAGVVTYPFSGYLMDRFGARVISLLGNILFGLSVMAIGGIGSARWQAYMLFGAIGAFASLSSSVLFSKVISGWFSSTRGILLALTTGLAFAVGGIIMPLLAANLVGTLGWRHAYFVLGLLPLVVSTPAMYLLLHERGAVGEASTSTMVTSGIGLGQALATPVFWTLLVAVALGAGSVSAISSHIASLLPQDRSANAIAWTIAGLSASTGLWQLVVGRLLDRVATPLFAAPSIAVAAVGAWLVVSGHGAMTSVLGGILLGIGAGTEFSVLPYSLSRYFGMVHYGALYGLMFGVVSLSIGFFPFLIDVMFQHYGSYAVPATLVEATLLLCSGAFAMLPRYRFDTAGNRLCGAEDVSTH